MHDATCKATDGVHVVRAAVTSPIQNLHEDLSGYGLQSAFLLGRILLYKTIGLAKSTSNFGSVRHLSGLVNVNRCQTPRTFHPGTRCGRSKGSVLGILQ